MSTTTTTTIQNAFAWLRSDRAHLWDELWASRKALAATRAIHLNAPTLGNIRQVARAAGRYRRALEALGFAPAGY